MRMIDRASPRFSRPRLSLSARRVALPGLALAALAALSAPVSAEWKSEWYVQCSAETLGSAGAEACDANGIGSASVLRRELEEASRWLAALGFREPAVETIPWMEGQPYTALIADEELGENAGGSYDPPGSGSQGGLTLSSEIAGETPLGGESVHEIFHGVQQSYTPLRPLYAGPIDDGLPFPPAPTERPFWPDHHWITEGTAEAVRIAFGKVTGRTFVGRPKRQYDSPLHYPCEGCAPREQRLQTYETANFWLWVGEKLSSPDSVGYLPTLWEAIGANPGFENQGIRPVDAALRAVGGEGLGSLFSDFIAERAHAEVYFQHVGQIDLQGPVGSESRGGTIPPLAAHAFRVRVSLPEGEVADFEIKLAEDHPDLRLVVDRDRLDRPVAGQDRNKFERELVGRAEPYEFFVRVVNAAENATASVPRDFDLKALFPAPPLAGNLHASFQAFDPGDPNAIPWRAEVRMQWDAVLNISTSEPFDEIDPDTGEALIVYPDDGTEWRLAGRYVWEPCILHDGSCMMLSEQTFGASGRLDEGGGTLRIVTQGDAVHLEARLPVSVTTTELLSPSVPTPTVSEDTAFWTISCDYGSRFWSEGLPWPLSASMSGPPLPAAWDGPEREAVSFNCAPGTNQDPSPQEGFMRATVEGLVRLEPE